MITHSIVIPYRDKYEMLLTAVNSIPDRADIQIIIIDNSVQPLDELKIPAKVKSVVNYLTSNPTKGAGHARNVGLLSVQGKYVHFLDADDYFTENAFDSFDKFVGQDYDIVFFRPTSIFLKTGEPSKRHLRHWRAVANYMETGNEELLRYRWEGPVCKMFRSSLIKDNNIKFDEIRVSNDAWFSLMAGHAAKKITAVEDVVYVITEGEAGQSLVKTRNPENQFLRYQVQIRINKFLKKNGHNNVRIRLLGAIRAAYKEFGFLEMCKYIKYALSQKVSIF